MGYNKNMKKSSSFLKKNQEKIRFSVAPVIEIEEFEGSDPLDKDINLQLL